MKGTFHLSIGQMAAGFSGFVLTIGLVRIFDQAEYGLYSYIFSIVGIIAAFTLSGMDTVVAQSVAKGADGALIQGFWLKLKWSIPVGVLSLFIGVYYLYQGNIILGASIFGAGIFIPIIYACSLYGAYFNGKKQFKKIALDNTMKNSLTTGGVLLVAVLTKDVIFVILAYFVLNTIISLLRFIHLAKKIAGGPTVEKESILFGKHLSAMDALSTISTQIDKLLVFQLLGATPLAVYTLALAPVKQLQGVSKIIRSLILPKFSNRSLKEIKEGLTYKLIIIFLFSIGLTAIYWVAIGPIFMKLFPEYEDAIIYTQILSLSLLSMPFVLHIQAFTTLHKKTELYIINIIKPVIKIILLLILVPTFGIWGAIVSFLCAIVVTAIFEMFFFMRIKVTD